MNPELPKNPRDEMEQRLTALLLGELSAEEAAALHRAMEQDGELAKLFARLHHTVGLVRETVVSPSEPPSAQAAPVKLSATRREKLLAHFKTIAPKEFTPEKRRVKFTLVELAAMLVILGLLAAISLPTLNNFRTYRPAESQVEFLPETKLDRMELSARRPDQHSTPSLLDEGVVNFGARPTTPAEPESVTLEEGRERLGYGLNRGESLAVDFATSGFDADTPAKRPSAITRPPTKPSPPIVLPPPAANYGYFDGGGVAGGDDVLSVGGKAEQGDRFYRIARESGRGGSGAPQAAGTFNSGQPGSAPGTEPLLSTDIQLRYASPANMASALQSLADGRGQVAPRSSGEGFSLLGPKEEIETAEKLVRKLDVPTRQTLVESEPGATDGEAFRNRGLTRGALVDPATGLPVAGPGDLAGTPGQQLETRTFNVRPEVLYRALKGVSSSVVNESSEPSSQSFIIPRVSVTGSSTGGGGGGGGAGGGGGLPSVFVTNSVATIQNDSSVFGSDWYAGSKLNEGKDALADQAGTTLSVANQSPQDLLNRGAITTLSGRAGVVNLTDGTTPLGDLPKLGRPYKDSDRNGVAPASPVPDGGRIAPEPNIYSVDAVGYAGAPTQPAISTGIASNESVRRQPTSIVLPGAVTFANASEATVVTDAAKPADDSLLTAGQTSKEVLLAKVESADRNSRELQADLKKNRAYVEKQRQLQDELDIRRLLTRKMNLEKIDLSLPKSSQIEVIKLAEANSAPSQSTWGKLRSAVSGDVERAATLKLERDKSDIEDNSGSSGRFSPYDPYFVQTEFDTIQSETILGKVVGQLKLDELWAKQKGTGAKLKTNEAIAMLRERLDLRPVPNTTLVEIRAKSAKPEEAAQIANAVAETYKKWRLDRGYRLVSAGVEELEKQSAMQDEKIRQAKVELERLRTELNISDADAGVDPTPIRKPSTNAPIPQPEIPTSENNFSTFSLNVSDVSFKLAAASLEKGQMPDAASVRSEEFINAFDYRDPEPAAGSPIAFAYERARYPFAHNRDLLRFSLKTAAAGRQAGRPLNIVLLLDNSGSMERADRVQIIREALRVLASQLQPQDKLSVIIFARTARLVADGISGDKAGEVAEQVSGITPQGGTNLEDAMNLAYQTAARHYLANGINRVVLLTDGAANLGDVEPESLKQKVEAQRQQGIALDCFGIGWEGLNDDLLEVLSRNGDGRYGFINSPEEAATDFVGQLAGALKVAASDVKVQVEFNPKRTRAYRQIGYAKHQLTKEQFRDNTVDAAEIAAQEAGNALYTVEVNPAGSGPLCTVRVRYKVPGTTDYREQAWDVPYTGNALSLEQASPAMRLAASASAFSEWLVASPFAGEVTPDSLLGILSGVPEVFGADSRPRKLEWLIRQAKSVNGN